LTRQSHMLLVLDALKACNACCKKICKIDKTVITILGNWDCCIQNWESRKQTELWFNSNTVSNSILKLKDFLCLSKRHVYH